MREAESLAGAYSAGKYAIDEVIERQKYASGGRVPVAAPGGHDAPSGEVASSPPYSCPARFAISRSGGLH
jgi:hypothetical protein